MNCPVRASLPPILLSGFFLSLITLLLFPLVWQHAPHAQALKHDAEASA
jgi:hypothetical protein